MTECLLSIINDGGKEKYGAMGRTLPAINVEIVDENHKPVLAGVTGELLIKSPLMFSGYLKDKETTKRSFYNDYLCTGDLAHTDVDGFIWFDGRKKYLIISNASNVSPEEVELAITEYCHIEKVCVVGKPHSVLGETPVAIIEGEKDSFTLSSMNKILEGKLANYKLPTELYILSRFPLTVSGKIDTKRLEKLVLEQ